jgi:hypothetical protein
METIGVDHVQFAVRHVAASVRFLSRHGYELQFQEPHFNSEARSYYRGIRKDMAFLERGPSRVELITGTEQREYGRYIPIFDCLESTDRRAALDMEGFRAFWHRDLSAVCASRGGEAPVLDGIIVRTSRLEHSSAFWQLLGFKLISQDCQRHTLAFPRNMISMPLTIFLRPIQLGDGQEARVDDLGCSSIALITRSLCADRATLIQERYALSEVTPFSINLRPLIICFASGPSGELVELVEFGRTQ